MLLLQGRAVQDAGDALATGFAIFIAAIPRIIGFIAIILIGWFIASLIAKAISKLLHAVNFNDLARRSGFAGFVDSMGVKSDSSGVIAGVAKWFVRLIALVIAFDVLGLPAVSGVLEELLLWLPNVIVALVVLVVGGLAAGAVSNIVRGSTAEAGFGNPDLMATFAKGAIWAFSIIIALNQLGIAEMVVNTLLIGTVAAVALAAGLAFGLGGREQASRLLDRAGREASAHSGQAREAARHAQERTSGPGAGGGTPGSRPPTI